MTRTLLLAAALFAASPALAQTDRSFVHKPPLPPLPTLVEEFPGGIDRPVEQNGWQRDRPLPDNLLYGAFPTTSRPPPSLHQRGG